jgi:hypothetical protein
MVCGQLKWDIQPENRFRATVFIVMSGIGMTSGQWVKQSTAICSLLMSDGPNEVYVDVQKTGCRRGEVAHWGHRVTEDFGALAVLASTCPDAAILPHAWPYEALCDQLCRCFGACVRQIMDRLEHLEP